MSFRILSIVSIKATGFDSFVDLKQLLALCQGDLQVLQLGPENIVGGSGDCSTCSAAEWPCADRSR